MRWIGRFIQIVPLISTALLLFSPTQNTKAEGFQNEAKIEDEDNEKSAKESFIERTIGLLLSSYNVQIYGNPHAIHFLPVAFFHLKTGLNLGFTAQLFSRVREPYLYRMRLQVIASLRGNHKHKLVFEYPQIGNTRFGLILRGEWERDLQARYYGLGNDSVNDDELTNSKSENFVNEDFYLYTLKRPRLTLHFTYNILRKVRFWFGGGFQTVEPQLQNSPNVSFLDVDRPFGSLGGSGINLSFRLSRDTRPNDVFPAEGFFTELSFEPNFASVNEEARDPNGVARQTNVTFYRYTLSHAHFLPIKSNRLIFANRVAFEAISGRAPYYAFSEIAGKKVTRAVGGSQSLRGFRSRRFQDKLKLITLTELRLNYHRFTIMSKPVDLIFIAFWDNGRVWGNWSELSFNNFHSTFGVGVWLNSDNKFITRFEVGRSNEEIVPFLRLNTAF